MTTNILLIIIAVLLAVRIVLQVRQCKRAFEKTYCAPSEVESVVSVVPNDKGNILDYIKINNSKGYELVQVVPNVRVNNEMSTLLFFTRKKIKNFYEE